MLSLPVILQNKVWISDMTDANYSIYFYYTAIPAVLRMSVSAARSFHKLCTTLYFSWLWGSAEHSTPTSLLCHDRDGQVIAFGGDSHCGDWRGTCHHWHSRHWLLNLAVSAFAEGSPSHYLFNRRRNEYITTQIYTSDFSNFAWCLPQFRSHSSTAEV